MPTYDFECEACAYYTEIRQGFDGPSEHQCPCCGKMTLIKVFINAPSIMVRGEPKTIGQLADRNTANMGKYEIEDRNSKNKIHQNKNSPEYKRNQINKRINAMSKQEKIKWIKEGD